MFICSWAAGAKKAEGKPAATCDPHPSRERGHRDRTRRASWATQMTHSFPPMVYSGPDNSFLVDNTCGCFYYLFLPLLAHDASYMRGKAYI